MLNLLIATGTHSPSNDAVLVVELTVRGVQETHTLVDCKAESCDVGVTLTKQLNLWKLPTQVRVFPAAIASRLLAERRASTLIRWKCSLTTQPSAFSQGYR